MLSMKWIAGVFGQRLVAGLIGPASVLAIAMWAPTVHAQSASAVRSADDTVFLALRDAARNDDGAKAAELAARLSSYSIPSYVDYFRLKPRLREASAAEINDYLQRYAGSAIADRLRNDWLLELGKNGQWETFDQQYPQFALDDDLQLKCFALMSRASKGENVAQDARVLLVSPKNYGDACPALIAALAQAGQFNATDIWVQIRLASEFNQPALVRRYAVLTDASESLLLQAYDKPALVLARGAGNSRAAHEAFILALGRAAKNNPEQAATALTQAQAQLTADEQALGWAQIALPASQKLAPNALEYWARTGNVPLSLDAHQWKTRAALRIGDWGKVGQAISAMPPSLRSDPTWMYWLGRALKEQGKPEQANALFELIRDQTSFYGQLALEELGQKIVAPAQASPPSSEEVAAMATNPGFQRAIKFFELGLRFEFTREWNWELRKMTERQLFAAAEFARDSKLLDRMVNTSDRTRTEFDFSQRFPTPFNDIMHVNTESLGLDKAWVYGLIRQESRFVMDARSHVGASGLMQIMPATARYVAKKIGMTDFHPTRVNDIGTNILLGTNYLAMVLTALDGSQAMATAAYNAGPGRPRAWRSTLLRVVEGAIFAETIPFTETRGYVKNVLSNATYYAAMFENRPQSLRARLGTIGPQAFVAPDLP